MIYSKRFGLIGTEGLVSAVPNYLINDKKFVILLAYDKGMRTTLNFDTFEERDDFLVEMKSVLKCVEIK